MVAFIDNMLAGLRRPVTPTKTMGAPGTAVFGGFIQENEKDKDLLGLDRYKTYSDLLANVSIVAAGTRYFLNLVAKAQWRLEPTDHPESERLTDLASEMLFNDPDTPWHRIIRRAAMYRFYGFSIQEWTAKRQDKTGQLTFSDVSPRPQFTIERWDLDVDGAVKGVLQRSQQTHMPLYIPRAKTLYLVDDTLSDSPEGLGLFRHIVSPARRLQRYEQLEGFGFETDLRGVPVGRGPFSELAQAVSTGVISQADRVKAEKPIREFIKNHIKGPKLGILLDSITYESKDEAGKASNAKQWEIELLKSSTTSLADNARAIMRLNQEIARILGVEQLVLGADAGSFALSKDKTNNFFLIIDSTLMEVASSVNDDLLSPLWALNGWPEEAKPSAKTEATRFKDIDSIAATLRDMATAGAILDPNDPVINNVRDLLGVEHAPEVSTTVETENSLLDAVRGGVGVDEPEEDDV